jgi:hypothetical protein
MIKRYSFTISFALIFYCSPAQFDTTFAKTNIRRCADSLVAGFRAKNWELFARYNSPALIGSMGGKNEFINNISMMFSTIPDSCWKQYQPGKILQVIKTGPDLFTVVELHSILDWQGKRITTVSYLVGESWDGGMFWTFFDSGDDRSVAMGIKPDLNEQLIIPRKTVKTEPISILPKTKNNP